MSASPIIKLEDILQGNSSLNNLPTDNALLKKSIGNFVVEAEKVKSPEQILPNGKPKSGRVWKAKRERFRSVIKTRGLQYSFEKKQKLRVDLKRVKETARALVNAKKTEKENKRLRKQENLRRREENRKKSEIVQVIKNSTKIKKMKKKHLRNIEKRDTSNI